MRYVLFFVSATVALAVGCGNSSFDTGNPLANLPSICEDDGAPEGCGDSCETASSCGSGTFCQDGLCDAVCTPEGGECGSAGFCSSAGRCIPLTQEGGAGGNGGGSECQSVQVTPTRSIPNVMFLVDQSSSMNSNFPGAANRWAAARTAITGITSDLEGIVRFGLTTYTSSGGTAGGECPKLPTQVDFALDNAAAIAGAYPSTRPSRDGGDTPTGDSIDALVEVITSDPPPSDGPTIIVLATDGLPDSCADPNPPDNDPDRRAATEDLAVKAAENAFDSEGIETFILSVGPDVSDSHLREMANVGIGLPRDTPEDDAALFWKATNADDLTTAFEDIVRGSISCEVEIDKPFANVEQACRQGDVRLNGSPITCPNGWRVKPGANNIIELLGSACSTFKEGVSELTAEFPCGAVVVQ